MPASSPWTLEEEIFEKERTLAAVQGSTAGQARYFAIRGRPGRSFNPNNLVLRCAVWTLELSRHGYGNGYGAPLYNYAASGYGYAAPAVAPAQGTTTIIIVTPAPAYTAPQVYAAPPVTTGYYAASAVSQPLYNYAPWYGCGYTPGYWNRGYWGRYYRW